MPSAPATSQLVLTAVRATFNAAAPHFDSDPLFFWDICGRRTVELAKIEPGNRVLDVCCGAGASALPAAEMVTRTGTVVGVDIADRLLARARAKAYARGLKNVQFRAGEMDKLDIADGCMDVVLCVLGLYYAPDPQAALAELWRTVRPGGTLAITLWGERSLEPANTMYLDAVAEELPDLATQRATPLSRMGDRAALTEVFLAAGAPAPSIVEEILVHPTTASDFWTIVLGSGYRAAVGAMSPAATSRVRAALRRRMEDEDVRELTSDVIYASAHKA